VELEDRITIATPEGVELGIVLAGAASRFIAGTIDLLIQILLIGLAALVTLALLGGDLGLALFVIALFAALYLYDILFEVLASGRTPGKRMTHLRVVRDGGTPVDLPASAIRNLLRLIDMLPGAYLVGLLAIVFTRRNQRLGDLAAGTLVIRDPTKRKDADEQSKEIDLAETARWDVSAVSPQELAAVRRFLERRSSLDRQARLELAYRLAQGLRTKVAGAPPELEPEPFLELLARVKSTR
jgi:uncharacterized RDD family membrane protein YckC